MPSLEDEPLACEAVKRRDVDAILTYTIPSEAGGENPKQVVVGISYHPSRVEESHLFIHRWIIVLVNISVCNDYLAYSFYSTSKNLPNGSLNAY